MLFAGLALLGVAVAFGLLWWWLWREVGAWTLLIVSVPLLFAVAAAEAR